MLRISLKLLQPFYVDMCTFYPDNITDGTATGKGNEKHPTLHYTQHVHNPLTTNYVNCYTIVVGIKKHKLITFVSLMYYKISRWLSKKCFKVRKSEIVFQECAKQKTHYWVNACWMDSYGMTSLKTV